MPSANDQSVKATPVFQTRHVTLRKYTIVQTNLYDSTLKCYRRKI